MDAYEQALAWVTHRGRFGELGLHRIQRLLEALGHPEDATRAIHIVGTSGKGSTAAFAASVLQQGGHRVGLFTSPHLVDPRERIQVNRTLIPKEAFAELAARVRAIPDDPVDPATEFELWCTIAFLFFKEAGADVAVVEAGLGGRHDATNAMRRPAACVMTTVGLDHVERLGKTIRAIARDKAAVAKRGAPFVLGRLLPEAAEEAEVAAASAGTETLRLGRDFAASGLTLKSGTWLSYEGARKVTARLSLDGAHQADNAACALTAALLVDPHLSAAALRRGLETASWPGRLGWIGGVLTDGMHSPDRAVALRRSLDVLYPKRPLRLLYGCLRDRSPKEVLSPLWDRIEALCAVAPPSERALRPAEVAGILSGAPFPVTERPSVEAGLKWLASGPAGSLPLVTGSLYLVGEVYAHFGREYAV